MRKAETAVGAVVELKSGGGKMTVIGEPDGTGLLEWISCALNGPAGVQCVRLPKGALRFSDDPEISAQARNKVGVETLRETFKLRAGCDRVDHAAEDAAAEYRAYRAESAIDKRLEQSEALQDWCAAAASHPDDARLLYIKLRVEGDELRRCAANLLEALARCSR